MWFQSIDFKHARLFVFKSHKTKWCDLLVYTSVAVTAAMATVRKLTIFIFIRDGGVIDIIKCNIHTKTKKNTKNYFQFDLQELICMLEFKQ